MPVNKETGLEQSRRDQILVAAREVFREKGYDRTTVSDVVRRAGVAQGTFYLYFPSKKEAFLALAQELPKWMSRAVMGVFDPSLDFEERVRVMTRAAFQCCAGNADLVRLIKFGGDSIAVDVQAQQARTHPLIGALANMLRQDIADGIVAPVDPEIAAKLIMGMYESALTEAFVLGTGPDTDRVEKALVDLVTRALKRHT